MKWRSTVLRFRCSTFRNLIWNLLLKVHVMFFSFTDFSRPKMVFLEILSDGKNSETFLFFSFRYLFRATSLFFPLKHHFPKKNRNPFPLFSDSDFFFLNIAQRFAYEKLRVEMRGLVRRNFCFFKSKKFCAITGAAIFYMRCCKTFYSNVCSGKIPLFSNIKAKLVVIFKSLYSVMIFSSSFFVSSIFLSLATLILISFFSSDDG